MSDFVIYPAIDIRGGKCVRLFQGDYDKETVYHDDPVAVAREWEAQGARWLHVVDLDGAKAGRPVNAELIGRIAAAVRIPVQTGGGLRRDEDVARLIGLGAARVILGTAAIEDRAFVVRMLEKFGDRIAIGIDARDGLVATRGWLQTSQVRAEELAAALAAEGAATFIFTDIARDGTLSGPNVEAIVRLARASGRTVIASGGVKETGDLLRLAAHRKDGVGGAIVGKALYAGGIRLAEALKAIDHLREKEDADAGETDHPLS